MSGSMIVQNFLLSQSASIVSWCCFHKISFLAYSKMSCVHTSWASNKATSIVSTLSSLLHHICIPWFNWWNVSYPALLFHTPNALVHRTLSVLKAFELDVRQIEGKSYFDLEMADIIFDTSLQNLVLYYHYVQSTIINFTEFCEMRCWACLLTRIPVWPTAYTLIANWNAVRNSDFNIKLPILISVVQMSMLQLLLQIIAAVLHISCPEEVLQLLHWLYQVQCRVVYEIKKLKILHHFEISLSAISICSTLCLFPEDAKDVFQRPHKPPQPQFGFQYWALPPHLVHSFCFERKLRSQSNIAIGTQNCGLASAMTYQNILSPKTGYRESVLTFHCIALFPPILNLIFSWNCENSLPILLRRNFSSLGLYRLWKCSKRYHFWSVYYHETIN